MATVLAPSKSMSAPTSPPGPLVILTPDKKLAGPSPAVTSPAAAPVAASPELLAELAEYSRQLEGASPREIIAWAVEKYFPKLTMATAFGPEGCVIMHLLAEVEPRTHVFNLDTGYQFKETLELRDRIAKRYGIEVEMRRRRHHGRRIRSAARRPAVQNESRSVLLRSQGHGAAPSRSSAGAPG